MFSGTFSHTFTDLKWATSFEGRDIPLFASSEDALSGGEKPLIFMGGVHGDEPEGYTLAEKTLEWLQSESNNTPKTKPWILIPRLNVDGCHHNTRVNGQGIDLNRNYPSRSWVTAKKTGGPEDRYWPGSSPCAAPEIASLVKLIETAKPRLIIHCHSWHPCIVIAGPLDNPEAQILAKVSGYELKPDIGYPTPGSLSEYGWKDHGIPVICIEEQEGIELSKVWPNFQKAIKKIFFDLA